MATETERLIVSIEANTKKLLADMKKAGGIVDEAARKMESDAARIGKIAGAVGAGVGFIIDTAIGAIVELARSVPAVVRELAAIGDAAAKIGITTTALQELQFAAERSGSSASSINQGLVEFQKASADAAAGSGQLLKILEANGVKFTDAAGNLLPLNERLAKFAELVKNAKNPADQLELTVRAFGRGAADLAPLLAKGAFGINGLKAAAQDTGAVIDEDLIAKAQTLKDKFDDVATVIAGKLKTGLIWAAAKTSDWIDDLNKVIARMDAATAGGNIVGRAFSIGRGEGTAGSLEGFKMTNEQIMRALGRPIDTTAQSTTVPPDSGGRRRIRKERDEYAELIKAADARIKQLEVEATALGMTKESAAIYRAEQELLAEALDRGVKLTDEMKQELSEKAEVEGIAKNAVEELKDAQEDANKTMAEFNGLAQDALGSFVSDLKQGTSAAEALSNMLDRIADKLLNLALETAFSGSGGKGGLIGDIFKRAGGGPVSAGSPYMVGERGPEMFVPSTSGKILPNKTGGIMVQNKIINQAGADVQSTAVKDGRGNVAIQTLIRGTVADEVTRSGTNTNRALKVGYGLRPALTRR